jgi:hypothetical protein
MRPKFHRHDYRKEWSMLDILGCLGLTLMILFCLYVMGEWALEELQEYESYYHTPVKRKPPGGLR